MFDCASLSAPYPICVDGENCASDCRTGRVAQLPRGSWLPAGHVLQHGGTGLGPQPSAIADQTGKTPKIETLLVQLQPDQESVRLY